MNSKYSLSEVHNLGMINDLNVDTSNLKPGEIYTATFPVGATNAPLDKQGGRLLMFVQPNGNTWGEQITIGDSQINARYWAGGTYRGWERLNGDIFNDFTVTDTTYVGSKGYQIFKNNKNLCYCSINFNVQNTPPNNAVIMKGFPKPYGSQRAMVTLVQSANVSLKGYIDNNGNLVADNAWTNGWVNGSVVYPITN